MRLLLVRHGLTQWNLERRIQGHTDIELSDEGRAQIRRWQLPAWCRNAVSYSSPFRRAQETARLLALEPDTVAALGEMSWGEWEGLRLADLRADPGKEMHKNESRGVDFRPPGGESPRDVQRRALQWLNGLRHDAVVAITHKGVITALYAAACDWDMRSAPPHKLRWHCAHEFHISDGAINVATLNVPLDASA